jgi:hypothetical protein
MTWRKSYNPQPTNVKITRSLSDKIEIEAAIISKQYIKILESGKEPATLFHIIECNKYGILESINDKRVNMYDTLEKVRTKAHFNIKCELQLRPDLAQRLLAFRSARQKQDELESINEQRNWLPLPALA